MNARFMPALALVALTGCASAPAPVVVPKEVLTPVLSCPVLPALPAAPSRVVPASGSADDVKKALQASIVQLEKHAEALRALLAPYTGERTEQPTQTTPNERPNQ